MRPLVRHSIVWVACLVAAVAGVAADHARETGAEGAARPAPRTHVVRRGETLWGIAARLVGRGGDPRPLVDAIASRNALTGDLVPGQVLYVPPW